MSKHTSGLTPGRADRTASSSGLHQRPRPRLAERLVALAPLARAPLTMESERQAANEPNALVPLRPSALPQASEPATLAPVSVSSHRSETEDEFYGISGYGLTGFLAGLAVATATGIVLYAVLA